MQSRITGSPMIDIGASDCTNFVLTRHDIALSRCIYLIFFTVVMKRSQPALLTSRTGRWPA
jgi:hypothetical protein